MGFTKTDGRQMAEAADLLWATLSDAEKTYWAEAAHKANIRREREAQAPAQIPKPACPHYTREDGCPLHGETCAPSYR